MVDRQHFFDTVRADLFAGVLNPKQVEGMEQILKEYEHRGWTDKRWLAACLGTARIETGVNMWPVQENLNYSAKGLRKTWPNRFTETRASEFANRPRAIANYVYAGRNGNVEVNDGWNFRGRGYPQTTGRMNYVKIQKAAKDKGHDWDLVANPDLLLQPDVAVFALFEGMGKGIYTGRKLSDYFNANEEDFKGSRSIINGQDKAIVYADYCKRFLSAIQDL